MTPGFAELSVDEMKMIDGGAITGAGVGAVAGAKVADFIAK